MADDVFKLPGSSYGEVVKIVRAYGHAPEEAVPKEVADRAGIDQTQVSRNNGFLLSIGVVSGGNKKSLTPSGRVLAQALDFEMPDQIEHAWCEIANTNDFLKKIVSAVRIRGGMEPSALRNHVAYTAGQPKSPQRLTGAGTVVDVLKAAGLLREVDGKIVAAAGEPLEDKAKDRSTGSTPATATAVSQTAQVPLGVGVGNAVLSIQVRIDCRPEELESLGTQLKALLDSLASPSRSEQERE